MKRKDVQLGKLYAIAPRGAMRDERHVGSPALRQARVIAEAEPQYASFNQIHRWHVVITDGSAGTERERIVESRDIICLWEEHEPALAETEARLDREALARKAAKDAADLWKLATNFQLDALKLPRYERDHWAVPAQVTIPRETLEKLLELANYGQEALDHGHFDEIGGRR